MKPFLFTPRARKRAKIADLRKQIDLGCIAQDRAKDAHMAARAAHRPSAALYKKLQTATRETLRMELEHAKLTQQPFAPV